jgi:hypothetical protein
VDIESVFTSSVGIVLACYVALAATRSVETPRWYQTHVAHRFL